MTNPRTYDVNGLCTVSCDADSVVGRLIDLHLSYFASTDQPDPDAADIRFHADMPVPGPGHVFTSEGLIIDGDTVYVDEGRVAIRITEERIDVHSTRGLTPHLFMQIMGIKRGYCIVHAAALSHRGRGILLPAWGGVGKTSLVMSVIHSQSAKLLGDDMVFMCGREGLKPYPIPFSVYHYHCSVFPELFKQRGKRRGIAGGAKLGLLHLLRPIAMPLVAAHPKLEEFAKRFGRGYRPVPVLEILNRETVETSAPVKQVVILSRHTKPKFEVKASTKELAVRNLLGVIHYEFSCSPLLQYLTVLAAVGHIDLGAYFSQTRAIMEETIADAECVEMLIPKPAVPREIGDFFLSNLLDGGS